MTINKVGILIPHLHNNQIAYEATTQLNKLKEENPNIDAILFTEEDRPQTVPAYFGIMTVAEAYEYEGLLIATTPGTAAKLIHCWGADKKVFYNYDCYWMRGPRSNYEALMGLYTNNEFDIIARSQSHKTILENNFNVQVKHIVGGFDIAKIIDIYNNELQEITNE